VTFESNAYSPKPLGDEFEAAQTTLKESVMTNGVTLKIGCTIYDVGESKSPV